ncbi:DUF1963 domain-containing protein [Streptomyces sp. MST-110588]|uniref:DUF1963 domain-containing protein n=1 Tax=Streptomyces sp. MST-110588 TaxID=2833628 RepID=UPI001F5CC2F1|nr:DUF1963 domain-containing protein [Streptomyces sp. MST-110588]UNO38814.1 DUF1963 domain-containing protein [Streptomyces sp. MST-110588]
MSPTPPVPPKPPRGATRTTPPRPVDVEAVFPEVVPFRREAVRLHPRAGDPGVGDSSVGGPLLWPRDEPWPYCDDVHPRTAFAPARPGAQPMVPVLQLYADDVPELPFPEGKDVLQVLWCPFDHQKDYMPRPQIHWRNRRATATEYATPPRPEGVREEYLPAPCVLHPERIVEYPNWDLPDDLWEELEERCDQVEEETGWSYWSHLSVADGIKAGGYPSWTQEPSWPDCTRCGARMDHLLTVSSREFDGESWRTWLPLEDRPGTGTGAVLGLDYDERRRIQGAHGLMLGDMGGVYLFVCRSCPGLPFAHRSDCS